MPPVYECSGPWYFPSEPPLIILRSPAWALSSSQGHRIAGRSGGSSKENHA